MEPFQSTLRQRFGLLLSVLTFGLLAPFFVSFRKIEKPSEPIFDNQKRNYLMSVNQTEEDNEMTDKLLPSSTRR